MRYVQLVLGFIGPDVILVGNVSDEEYFNLRDVNPITW
jgi:hypothetical protein